MLEIYNYIDIIISYHYRKYKIINKRTWNVRKEISTISYRIVISLQCYFSENVMTEYNKIRLNDSI